MEITTRRRRALSTTLALFLAIESVSAVAAVAVVGRPDAGSRHALPDAAPAGVVYAEQGAAEPVAPVTPAQASVQSAIRGTTVRDTADTAGAGPSRSVAAAALKAPAFAPRPAVAEVKPAAKGSSGSGSASSSSGGGATSSGSYKGTNHFWFPALGINRTVYSYPCSRKTPLANLVYRWGCAGANNVYIMGHAWGVMKPLHDAYVNGRLRTGMTAWYADSSGRTHKYTIKWWKLTRPTTAASWAWAAQSVPSMTLQTCIGANSEYRLMVRLVEVR